MAQTKDGIGLPAQLIALGLAGGAVLGFARKDRSALGRVAELALLGAAVWAAVGLRIVPLGAARRSVCVRTSLVIKRPVADVFAFFRDFSNFPALVGGLSSVEDYDDGRSRWSVQTFAGRTLEWETVLTKFVPNQVIGWESTPGGDVESRGVVRFEALSAEETKVDIELRYHPIRTDVVEALYALHESRQQRVDTDLRNIGEYIESRSTSREPGSSDNRAVAATPQAQDDRHRRT